MVLLVTPLSLSPAAERLPEFSAIGLAPAAVLTSGGESDADSPRFAVDPIPEPSSWALMVGSIGCFLLVRRRY